MGSKKHKKESRKRKHHSRSESRSPEREEKEKRKHKKRHHKDKKREKPIIKRDRTESSSNSDDDVIYVPPPPKITKASSPTPPPAPQITKVRSPSPPPTSNNSATGKKAEQSLSVDDTNALRAKLGLKPLAVKDQHESAAKSKPSNTFVCPETNVEFVHKPAESLTQKKMSEKLRHRLAEKKEKRELEKKLQSLPSLGAVSDDEGSAVNWVKKSRKLDEERRKAEQKAKELDEMDEVFGIGDLVEEEIKKEKYAAYTGASLKGLKVEHDIDSFTEGKSIILTLKDKGVLEEEGDALVNVNMLDDERYKKNVLIKKINPYNYNGLNEDDDEMGDNGVLAKYDEEIEGVKKTSFKLGETTNEQTKKKLKSFLHDERKMKLESLATTEMKLANDYYSVDEIKIKKPKKKKKIRSRLLKPDDLMGDAPVETNHRSRAAERGIKLNSRIKVESEDPMDVDGQTFIPVLSAGDVKVEEESDTELELALKKARRLKDLPMKKPKRIPKIEDVLTQIKEEPEDENGAASSIVLNSTAEFCRTLGDIPTYGMAGNRDEEPDVLLDFDKTTESKKKKQEVEDRGGWNEVEIDDKLVDIAQIEGSILDAEPDLGSGVGGALRLSISKGYLEKETNARPSASRTSHLTAQNYSIDDKAHALEDEKAGRRERYLGPTMDFKEKDTYKPNIKLEYIDDDGHLLSAKEAFRYLSHKFHGKGPGKNKVEKRMKKNEQEVLMKQMSSSDTPLGTLQMLQHKQKETQSAFVVLSGSKALNTPSSISKTKMSK